MLAPTPCTARLIISAVAECAVAQPIEANIKRVMPVQKIVLMPNESESLANNSRKAESVSK